MLSGGDLWGNICQNTVVARENRRRPAHASNGHDGSSCTPWPGLVTEMSREREQLAGRRPRAKPPDATSGRASGGDPIPQVDLRNQMSSMLYLYKYQCRPKLLAQTGGPAGAWIHRLIGCLLAVTYLDEHFHGFDTGEFAVYGSDRTGGLVSEDLLRAIHRVFVVSDVFAPNRPPEPAEVLSLVRSLRSERSATAHPRSRRVRLNPCVTDRSGCSVRLPTLSALAGRSRAPRKSRRLSGSRRWSCR